MFAGPLTNWPEAIIGPRATIWKALCYMLMASMCNVHIAHNNPKKKGFFYRKRKGMFLYEFWAIKYV